VSNLITIDAVTSSALGFGSGKAAVGPRCAAPLPKLKGTGLPVGTTAARTFDGTGLFYAAAMRPLVGVGMGPDQVQQTAVRIPVAVVQETAPRRTPPRC
jgi:hypothetical protein